MVQIEQDRRRGNPSMRKLKESIVERACKFACVAALIVMLVVIGVDILTRSLFNFSFEISDELGGYMLVVIAFVSLPVCQISDSFHHVELVQSRLSPFGRANCWTPAGVRPMGCACGAEARRFRRIWRRRSMWRERRFGTCMGRPRQRFGRAPADWCRDAACH